MSTRCLRLKQPLIATSTLLDKVSLGLVLLVRSGYVILKSFKVCPSVYLYMSVHHASAFHHMNNFSLVGTLWWALWSRLLGCAAVFEDGTRIGKQLRSEKALKGHHWSFFKLCTYVSGSETTHQKPKRLNALAHLVITCVYLWDEIFCI